MINSESTKQEVLDSIKEGDWGNLYHANPAIQDDEEVVLAAISHDSEKRKLAFAWASQRLREDAAFIFKASTNNPFIAAFVCDKHKAFLNYKQIEDKHLDKLIKIIPSEPYPDDIKLDKREDKIRNIYYCKRTSFISEMREELNQEKKNALQQRENNRKKNANIAISSFNSQREANLQKKKRNNNKKAIHSIGASSHQSSKTSPQDHPKKKQIKIHEKKDSSVSSSSPSKEVIDTSLQIEKQTTLIATTPPSSLIIDSASNTIAETNQQDSLSLEQNNHQETLAELNRVLEADSKNIQALNQLGSIHLEQNKNEEAFVYYNRVLEIDNNNIRALNECIYICLRQEKYDEALPYLNRVLEVENNNTNTMSLYNRSFVFYNQKKYKEALADIQIILDSQPNNVKVLLLRSNTYAGLGETEKALADLNRVLEVENTNIQALNLLGYTHLDENKKEEALVYYNRVLEIDNNNIKALKECGYICIKQKKYDEALAYLNRVLEVDNNNAMSLYNRSFVFYHQKKNKEALADIQIVLDSQPNKVNALLRRSKTYVALGETEKALDDLNRVLELDNNNIDALYRRPNIYIEQAQFDKALNDLNKILELEKDNTEILDKRSLIYFVLGQYDKALFDINKLLSLVKGDKQSLLNNRGRVYSAKGELDLALVNYTEVLKLDNSNIQALNERSRIYIKKNQFAKALSDAQKVLDIEPGNIKALINRGIIDYSFGGHYEDTLNDINQVLETLNANRTESSDASYATALYVRSTILSQKGAHEAIIEDLEKVIHIQPDNNVIKEVLAKHHDLLSQKKTYTFYLTDVDINKHLISIEKEALKNATIRSIDGSFSLIQKPINISNENTSSSNMLEAVENFDKEPMHRAKKNKSKSKKTTKEQGITQAPKKKAQTIKKDKTPKSPEKNLIYATVNRNTNLMQSRILKGDNVDSVTETDGPTLLEWCVDNNFIKGANILLDNGANIKQPNQIESELLIRCIINKNIKMFKLLLSFKPDIKAASNDYQSLLVIAAHKDNLEMVKRLLEIGIGVNEMHLQELAYTALEESLKNQNLEMFQLLLEYGASITSIEFPKGLLRYLFSQENRIEFASVLLTLRPDIIDKKYEEELTALDLSVKSGNLEAVKLLCHFGAKLSTEKWKKSTFYFAFKEASKAIVKAIANYKPPTLKHILETPINDYRTHLSITKAVLNDDFINENNIHRVPKHIKKVIYTNNACSTSLNLLQDRGITLIGPPAKMYIDEKYLGGRLIDIKSQAKVSPKSPRIIEDIYEQESNIIVKLPLLETFKEEGGQNNDLVPRIQNTELDHQFIAAPTKGPILETDKIFTVFAFRKDKACLPIVSDNNCRCMVVLTVEEYNSLKIPKGSDLAKYYDFLIVNERKKIDCNTDVKVSMLTERRRAAFNFARRKGINDLVFMDDNISEIAVACESTDKKGSEYLFDYLKHKMNETGEPLLSIATYSKLHKTINANQLGCKVWIENISKISEALPEECFDALMPYNEFRWGEDYYLQILLMTLFADEYNNIEGSKILPISEIQLKRSSAKKSTNAKGGMRVREYTAEDVLHPSIRQRMEENHPEILRKIDLARFHFNNLVRPAVEKYEEKKRKNKELNIRELRHNHLALKSCDICYVELPSKGSSSDTTLSLLTNKLKNGNYGDNELIIASQGKLFFVERNPFHIYEIEKNQANQSDLMSFQNYIEETKPHLITATIDELELITSLTTPVYEPKQIEYDFKKVLHTLFKDALNDDAGFLVTSKGREVKLRDYQNQAIDWLANHLDSSEHEAFTFNMATGTGKTVLMLIVALAAYSANQDSNVMLVFPSIQLVHQTLEKLFADFQPLLDHFKINREQVYGVCSRDSEALNSNEIISHELIAINDGLRTGGNLYLFCAASLKAFNNLEGLDKNEIEDRQSVMNNLTAVILDESHKLESLDHVDGVNLPAMQALSFKFSATPKKDSNEECPDNEFQYLRETAIQEERLTPLLVDKTLPDDCGDEDINHCLLNHKHPNGKTLKDHKGIIYTTSRTKANELAKSIQQAKNPDGTNMFPDGFAHVIHSGDKDEIDTYDEEDDTAVENFKKRKTGVAIVVKMLTEGYDDDNVDYVIVNKNFDHSEDLHQAIGRTLRLNKENPSKVGYALIRNSNHKVASQEVTCYPNEAEELRAVHEALVGNVSNTIKAFRQSKIAAGDISNDAPILTNTKQNELRKKRAGTIIPLGRKKLSQETKRATLLSNASSRPTLTGSNQKKKPRYLSKDSIDSEIKSKKNSTVSSTPTLPDNSDLNRGSLVTRKRNNPSRIIMDSDDDDNVNSDEEKSKRSSKSQKIHNKPSKLSGKRKVKSLPVYDSEEESEDEVMLQISGNRSTRREIDYSQYVIIDSDDEKSDDESTILETHNKPANITGKRKAESLIEISSDEESEDEKNDASSFFSSRERSNQTNSFFSEHHFSLSYDAELNEEESDDEVLQQIGGNLCATRATESLLRVFMDSEEESEQQCFPSMSSSSSSHTFFSNSNQNSSAGLSCSSFQSEETLEEIEARIRKS